MTIDSPIAEEVIQQLENMRDAIRSLILLGVPIGDAADMFKQTYAQQALVIHKGNQCKASRAVGAHRNTLHRILEKKAG